MSIGPPAPDPARAPDWLRPLVRALDDVGADRFARWVPPPEADRHSAVLVLFGDGPQGPDVLLIERASTLREHAGQPAFPGGGADPGDGGPVGTALREAVEETGLDPAGVDVLAVLPALFLPPSGFVVTPVLGWWRAPSTVGVLDAAEVAAVLRVPVADLVDPARRATVRGRGGFRGPAFEVGGLLVWGFTAGILDTLLDLGGWARPWDHGRELPMPTQTRPPLSP